MASIALEHCYALFHEKNLLPELIKIILHISIEFRGLDSTIKVLSGFLLSLLSVIRPVMVALCQTRNYEKQIEIGIFMSFYSGLRCLLS